MPATVSELVRVKEKISRPDSPPLRALQGQHANDVCLITSPTKVNHQAVFKPGKINSVKAMLCHDIAKALDLEESVPFAIEATAAQVIGKEGLNRRGKPIIYTTIFMDGKPWVANPVDCHEVEKEGSKIRLVDDHECLFSLEKEGSSSYNLKPVSDEAKSHDLSCEEVFLVQIDDKDHIVKCESAFPVTDGSHVKLGDARLELRHSNGVLTPPSSDDECAFEEVSPRATFRESTETPAIPDEVVLVRTNVEGFLQPMVQNVVTKINDTLIDIRYPSDVRTAFYKMINKISFTQGLILCALFRTQDGKCSFLEDSNILFTNAPDESLHLKLIDLDETMPEDNEHIRLGLMGYPHAHETLEEAERTFALSLLEKIAARQGILLACVDKYQLEPHAKIRKAFGETVETVAKFYEDKKDQPFSLADLIFTLFPRYKEQWQALEMQGIDKEEIADSIGYASLEEKQEELAARVVAASNNLLATKGGW